MRILVVGSGAREHALVRSLAADPVVDTVVAAPGNPGIARTAHCEPIGDPTDGTQVVSLAQRVGADLVVVGPEAPLVAGVADQVRAAGIDCLGPSAAAARLEGSKAFAKEVMGAADVPTALAHVCSTSEEVEAALDALGSPFVVKDDGLAAGKGVVVTDDRAAALAHAAGCLAKPEGRVVVEEFLDGPEVSLLCLCDGSTAVALAPAQDFKRVGDGDVGPNTGGMGAYSPLDWAPDDLAEQVLRRVARPVLRAMAERGTPFVGILYVGLALTARGPKVIEFNVRFGDPETQVVLARLLTPLGGLLRAAATGRLADVPKLRWSQQHAVTVVVAAQGYPGTPRGGDPVSGLDEAADVPAYVLQAGTALDEQGTLVSAGGRVLSVVALGDNLAQARKRAYAAVDAVDLPGSQHRTDIGLLAERGEVQVPGTGLATVDPEQVRAFWTIARQGARLAGVEVVTGSNALGALPPPAWAFGTTPSEAVELLRLVVDGHKTAAAGAAPVADADEQELPQPGELAILLDGRARPRALIVVTDVRVVPFDEVDADHARAEGHGDLSVDGWRERHQELSGSPVVLQRFRLLYRS